MKVCESFSEVGEAGYGDGVFGEGGILGGVADKDQICSVRSVFGSGGFLGGWGVSVNGFEGVGGLVVLGGERV